MDDKEKNFNLISIKEQDGKKLVDARELHSFLEIKRDFSNWIKYYIKNYDFVEQVDFTTLVAKSSGGRNPLEYAITIEMAKELSMVSRTKKGKEARRYFIEIEDKYNKAMPAFQELADAIVRLQKEVAVLQGGKPNPLALPQAEIEAPKISYRALINQRLRKFAQENDLEYFVPWGRLYEELYYRCQINVRKKAEKRGLKPLEVIAEEGLLEKTFAIACKIFKLKGE